MIYKEINGTTEKVYEGTPEEIYTLMCIQKPKTITVKPFELSEESRDTANALANEAWKKIKFLNVY